MTASVMESDLERSSMRANLVEQKLFELTVSSIETAKRGVVVDIRNAQNEMKKRLRKYRDRQREIFRTKSAKPAESMEAFLAGQILQRSITKNNKNRPKTTASSKRSKSVIGPVREVELDPSFFTDQQRSKIDLRPSTAATLGRDCLSRLAKIGRLGTPVAQIRYFDNDELNDRELLYNQLIECRKKEEKNYFLTLDERVSDFCENDPSKQRKKSAVSSARRMPVPAATAITTKPLPGKVADRPDENTPLPSIAVERRQQITPTSVVSNKGEPEEISALILEDNASENIQMTPTSTPSPTPIKKTKSLRATTAPPSSQKREQMPRPASRNSTPRFSMTKASFAD